MDLHLDLARGSGLDCPVVVSESVHEDPEQSVFGRGALAGAQGSHAWPEVAASSGSAAASAG